MMKNYSKYKSHTKLYALEQFHVFKPKQYTPKQQQCTPIFYIRLKIPMNVDFQIINTALFAKKIGSLFKWILISVMSIPRHYEQYYLSSSYVHLLSEVVLRWNITAEKLFWGTGVEIARLNDLN